ncbi:MAG: response regulator [SAR324 cluster bacterium]|nr:response regulator [SAR324 cluster bacterium]
MKIEDVVSLEVNSQFKDSAENTPSKGYTNSVYWLRFSLQNDSRETEWMLELEYAGMDYVTLFSPTSAGTYESFLLGNSIPFHQRFFEYKNLVFRLFCEQGVTKTFYLKFQTSGLMTFPLRLWQPAAFVKKINDDNYIQGAYYGVIFVMILYNLFVFFSLWDRSYLYYCIFIGVYGVLQLYMNNLAYEYLWPQYPQWNSKAGFALIYLCILNAFIFTRSFLRLSETAPLLDKIVLGISCYSSLGMFVSWWLNFHLNILLCNSLVIVGILVAIFSGVVSWKSGYSPARYYLLSWVALFLGILCNTFMALGILSYSELLQHAPKIGSILEVLLLSLGLADKRNVLQKETMSAQAKTLLIQKEANEHLEEKVQQRTLELQNSLETVQQKEQEITQINQLVQAVNSTLDLKQVVAVLMNALQKIFSFDQIGIWKMNEIQQSLVLAEIFGEGVAQDHLQFLKQITVPLNCESSWFVKTVQNNEPFYVSPITPELLQWFEPADQAVHQIVQSLSYLFYPLMVQGNVIGVIVFGNSQKPFSLQDSEILKIQRYVAQIATVINNAEIYERLEDFSRNLEVMVDQKTQELQIALGKLQRMDKLKDEFLANTSHELRTPVNGIIGIAESLMDGAAGVLSHVAVTNLKMVVQSGKRLASLVNDLLDFSKMKNHELHLQLTTVDIKSVTDIVLALSTPLLGTKNIRMINLISHDLPLVRADENRLQQIMLNLVGNAIKFTHEGEIKINALEEQGMIRVLVRDTGIGISTENKSHIFEAFEQGDGTTARVYGGTGLGLSITKKLVELHGGNIEVESSVGMGSTFSITLPISQTQTRSTHKLDVLMHLTERETEQGELIDVIPMDLKDKDAPLILVVDDEPVNVQVLKNQLTLHHYRVETAVNGFEALEHIRKQKPYLILLDLMMPRMSGYEVSQKVRETFDHFQLPIVMLTAKDQSRDLVQGFDYGVNDYLIKPFNKDELLRRVQTHLYLSQTTQSYARFVPKEFLEYLHKESIVEVKLGDNIQMNMSVMFSDIRSFTTLSEGMSPEENFKFLNAYLSRMEPVIMRNGGFIDKYIGDAIMALFGNTADNAVDAAVSMLKELELYNKHRHRSGYIPIKIGLGINTGRLMLGTIGGRNRMEGTVISDTVNLASRIEGLTKMYGASILIAEETFMHLTHPSWHFIRLVDRVRVKGKTESVAIYEIFDADTSERRDRKLRNKNKFEEALCYYRLGEFKESLQLFQECLFVDTEDSASKIYIERCQHYMNQGIDESWDGITKMTSK